MRYTGLQREVLLLYRECLRACRKKPSDTRPHFEKFTRAKFDMNLHLNKKEFMTIEYLLRKGRRQLELYSSSEVSDIRT
ncbi:Succinate dehydrogenase assembly factor 1, mitochondrial [Erysiphe necator]|uniref:Putative heat repeat protein n=1 Tax=Uncinula necator TaxID=52586 RepID=A0A0B1P6W9_UNCNE|nr:Succinate dehydrogenase assembly factor 1, mitochondrial [Erysiphe necator]KHJ34008.1 putative heat repeat protein [Erysiphe necator]